MDLAAKLLRAKRIADWLGVLFSSTDVPVIALTADGTFASANAAMIQQYGYPLDELLGMRVQDLIADARAIWSDLARAVTAAGGPFERRPHRRKDGSVIWVIPSAGPVIVDGETYIVSLLKEVTLVVEAEAKAHEATATNLRDRQLVQNAIHGMLRERELAPALNVLAHAFQEAIGDSTTVWIPDAPGSRRLTAIAAAGLALRDFYGLGERTLMLDSERIAARAWDTGETQILRLADAPEGTVAHAVMSRLGGHSFVAPLLGRDGPHGIIFTHGRPGDDLERALALVTTLGRFGGMILEAVQLERRAKDDEQRAEALWYAASERLSDGVSLLDHDLRVVRVNSAQCRLLDLDASEIIGKHCHQVFLVCQGVRPCPHQVAQAEQLTLVREVHRADGLPLRVEIIPIPRGADISVIHVVHDLTAERAMRTRLLSADRLASIGRLAAGVAHEVNNPAAFVTVNLGVLRDRFASGTVHASEMVAMLDESLNGMERIRDIVRDLKGFARERSRDVVDLSQVALSAIRMAAHETRGRAQVERVLGDKVLARVRGARVAQVVLNLLVNAAQAIPAGDPQNHRIVVRTYFDGDRVRLEVSDTGPGVPDELKQRIFEPFFTTREATGGTGLGLWLARGIVEEEHGTITLHDQAGGGARFVLDLPALHATAAAVLTASE